MPESVDVCMDMKYMQTVRIHQVESENACCSNNN